jgi:hypothetical protein
LVNWVNHKPMVTLHLKKDEVARVLRDQNLSLNKMKFEVEMNKLYWKNSQDYKHW